MIPTGTSNPAANPPKPDPQQLYGLLTDWVEKGMALNSVVLAFGHTSCQESIGLRVPHNMHL